MRGHMRPSPEDVSTVLPTCRHPFGEDSPQPGERIRPLVLAPPKRRARRPRSSADQTAPKADGHGMRARSGLQLRQQVADVRLDRLLAETESLADLPVDKSVRDQLEHLDLAGGRLLLELLERGCERDHLGGAVGTPGRDRLEAARMVHVATQDLLTLSSVHERAIGATKARLYPFWGAFVAAGTGNQYV
jgi:hypothetical protein